MRRAFCRLSGDGGLLGERAGVVGLLCVFRRTRGAEEHCPARRRSWGGGRRGKQGRVAQRETQGWEVGEKGDRAGKNRTWTDVRKTERPQATQGVCDRELTVCEGRNLRADGKCVWARRAESTCGVKPWIANSGRGRGVGRSGRLVAPASPHSHPQISPLPAKPLGSIPAKRRAHRGCFSSFRHALCRKARPAPLKTPGSHTSCALFPGPMFFPLPALRPTAAEPGPLLAREKESAMMSCSFKSYVFYFLLSGFYYVGYDDKRRGAEDHGS